LLIFQIITPAKIKETLSDFFNIFIDY